MKLPRSVLLASVCAGATLDSSAICPDGEETFVAGFSTNRAERAFRDVGFVGDLSRAAGIAFDFRCEDARAVSAFSVYLRSGDGWYSGAFSPTLTSRWNRVELPKDRFAVSEGRPAGWSRISGLRIALWRGGTNDTVFGIGRIRPLPQQPEIAVLRGDGCQAESPGEPCVLWASEMTERLRKAGFAVTEVSDREFDAVDLSGIRLVVLPRNPQVPAAALSALRRFRAAGGRLLVCRGRDSGLMRLMGIVRGAEREEVAETPAGICLKDVWRRRGEESDDFLAELLARLVPEWEARCAAFRRAAHQRRAADRAWLAAQKGKRGEWRAFWCADGKIPGGLGDWDAAARELRRHGFNAVLPNLAYAGEILPADRCLAACRSNGLECHLWKVCWRTRRDSPAKISGAAQVRSGGREEPRWMCPSDPVNRAAEVEDCLRLACMGPTGLQLDYIRYPGPDACFCDGCRKRFEQTFAVTVTNWPGDVRTDSRLAELWTEFRCSNVTALVREVSRRVRSECPGVQLSAAVCMKQASSRQTYGQDWVAWCREGLLDFVCPMDYWNADAEAFGRVVRRQQEALEGSSVRLRPGIGLTCWRTTEDDAIRMAREIQEVRACGLDGFAAFSCDRRGAAVLPFLHMGITLDVETNLVVSTDGPWVPVNGTGRIRAGSALDFSCLVARDAPAGRHGWLRNVDGHFEFEGLPGARQRFCGANLCMTAVIPTHEEADALVTDLVRMGYNAVRIHHHEQALAGGADRPGLSFDAEALDRFDYFVAKCVEAGIYLTTDLYVARVVRWSEIGLAERGQGAIANKNLYKSLVQAWEPAYENWCRYAEMFLTHVNPYTGRRYADEPAMPLLALVNEGQLLSGWKGPEDKSRDPVLGAAWRRFLAAGRQADPGFCPDAPADFAQVDPQGKHNAAFVLFNAALERKSALRMKDYLRSLGAKALLTSENCPPDHGAIQGVREELYDYVDNHCYVGHPRFLGGPWKMPAECLSANPVESGVRQLCKAAFSRIHGKPFVLTEWNFPGTGRFRGAAGLLAGTFAALQDWDGLWRFCYASSLDQLRGAGAPSFFPLVSDPLALASERATVALYLRGDMTAAPTGQVYGIGRELTGENGGRQYEVAPWSWCTDAWHCRVATSCRAGSDQPLHRLRMQKTPPFPVSGDDRFGLNREIGSFWVNTPMTSGGLSPGGLLDCGGIRFAAGGGAATVWASAIGPDDRSLKTASRILVVHLTDLQGDGTTYADDSCARLLRLGRTPALLRKGHARILVRLDSPSACSVWALDATGARTERIASTAESDGLSFTASVESASGGRIYYEIVRESAEWLAAPRGYGDGLGAVRKEAVYACRDCFVERYSQANGPGTHQKVLLVLPKSGQRHPAVVVPFYFPEAMLGFDPARGDRDSGDLKADDPLRRFAGIPYMLDLVRRGYAAVSAEAYHLTYDRAGAPKDDWAKWRHAGEALRRDWPGWTGIGKLTFDTRLLVDLLAADDRIDSSRIGILGHSLGGKMAFYAGMTDPRIRVVVASDFGIGWEQTNWGDVWYWGEKKRLAKAAGFDATTLLRASGGKPLCIIAGKYDDESSRELVNRVAWYREHPADFLFVNHATGHRPPRWATERGYEFLDRYLRQRSGELAAGDCGADGAWAED
ncbi:MAG: family 10 glycosylhydrolase [Kiritimatiellia bacterium]